MCYCSVRRLLDKYAKFIALDGPQQAMKLAAVLLAHSRLSLALCRRTCMLPLTTSFGSTSGKPRTRQETRQPAPLFVRLALVLVLHLDRKSNLQRQLQSQRHLPHPETQVPVPGLSWT
jgi:hypothetical protein